jgi:hypothetical protein
MQISEIPGIQISEARVLPERKSREFFCSLFLAGMETKYGWEFNLNYRNMHLI